jgi:N-acetylmuramoyl-L-alanine amidase
VIGAALLCLALNVFYEARGTTVIDREAVAAVALNRAEKEHRSVCKVIEEPRQFSWTAHHSLTVPKIKNPLEKKAWSTAITTARRVMYSRRSRRVFANVMYYHTRYVHPRWSNHYRVAFATNAHIYYLSS